MPRRSLHLLLGSGAVALAAAVTMGAGGDGASAGTLVHKASQTASQGFTESKASQTASHWFTQIEPAKGLTVFLRNGSTPTSAGKYRIAVQVTSRRHNALSCFAERRDGEDLSRGHTIAAGNTAPVIIATAVPAGTQYNLICFGTAQGREMLNGTITETSR
ncbi:hypothetical protein NE236_36065 [Actinoallomurus purpureus]|uniref:hypothetical protein n=1 Tax=Actinoallomurus purpureus TaxID=478114 RepID=UPI00209380DD|nr:hypothetical protein [Actinoallomurus purpureus]MCO6010394.1 hypothetical protein [Actinoallomurus purpureus]